MRESFRNGYIERKKDGRYSGCLTIEGIDLSPISALMFDVEGERHIWLRRSDSLVYDEHTQRYEKKRRSPYFEAYMSKTSQDGSFFYSGEFCFMKFMFRVKGVWEQDFGGDGTRMNLFVERLPYERQTIINGINKRKTDGN